MVIRFGNSSPEQVEGYPALFYEEGGKGFDSPHGLFVYEVMSFLRSEPNTWAKPQGLWLTDTSNFALTKSEVAFGHRHPFLVAGSGRKSLL